GCSCPLIAQSSPLVQNDFMLSRARFSLAAFAFFLLPSLAFADLEQYLRKPEPEFAWSLKDTSEQAGDRIYTLQVVSQNWEGITWRHELQVYQPKGAAPNRTLFLWVTGGSPRPAHALIGTELARKIGAPVAFLYNVPNQPLLEDGLYEDNLIAETFVRYLKTKDENWPLLFPMVKSVVKAMDALQAFAAGDWKQPVERFVVSGLSKRGWTTWLTAAADKRVAAIAPMVIDTLNMGAQMPKQIEAFGAFSERLQPYVKRGLLPIPQTPEGRRLLSMVDPWSYRDRFSMPKFIVNGSNDFYWVTDALNLYWKDLPGDKWVLYVPNTGHDLLQAAAYGRFLRRAEGRAAVGSGGAQCGFPHRHMEEAAGGDFRRNDCRRGECSGKRLSCIFRRARLRRSGNDLPALDADPYRRRAGESRLATAMPRLLVFQHVPHEILGTLNPLLKRAGFR